MTHAAEATRRTEPSTLRLRYLSTELELIVEPDVDVGAALRFFDTHFVTEPLSPEAAASSELPAASLHFTRRDVGADIDFGAAEAVWIRKSAADFFSIPASRVRGPYGEAIRCHKTGTTLLCAPDCRRISVGVTTSEAPMLDVIELIRDIVLKAEEARGRVILHATSVVRGDRAFLIVGKKGAGKSTIALDLVRDFECAFLSGDKTFVWLEAGRLVASGWPDWPHLGLGTLSKWPELCEGVGASARLESGDRSGFWSTTGKLALDPWKFRSVVRSTPVGTVAPVAGFLYPAIAPDPVTSVVRVEPHFDRLPPNIEHAFHPEGRDFRRVERTGAVPEQSLAALRDAIERVPAYALEGRGDLGRDAARELGIV